MSDVPQEDEHRRPHAGPKAGPFLEFDLTREMEELHRGSEWKNGQNARTLVKYDDLRVVLIALEQGARIHEHQSTGRISIQTVLGHIRVRAEGRAFDLPTGTLLVLDQDRAHDVEALKASAFLLTIAWPGAEGKMIR